MADYKISEFPKLCIGFDTATDTDVEVASIYSRNKDGNIYFHYIGSIAGAQKWIKHYSIIHGIKRATALVALGTISFFILAPILRLALFALFNLITGKHIPL